MKFAKKSRYALIALVDLSVNSKNGHVALGSIAERNGISMQYLEQVFASLRRADIVRSVKGPQGGYLLKRRACELPISSVLEAVEGSYHLEDEREAEGSANLGISDAIQTLIVNQINQSMDKILTTLTLADLERYYCEHQNYAQDMYYI